MKLINSSFEILHQEEGLDGIYKLIEKAGRTCYASDPIEDKAKDFVDRMIVSGHGAMLEHGSVYLSFYVNHGVNNELHSKYKNNKYSKVSQSNCGMTGITVYVSSNLRVLVENGWLEDLKYLCEPTEYHEKRITVNFKAISIGIAREFTRHRVFSFAQQSTRYCNYSKENKFGNHLQYIKPFWSNIPIGEYVEDEECKVWCPNNVIYDELPLKERCLISSLLDAESDYKLMIFEGCIPQEAREVLPLSLNAPLIMTGFISDWKHFFALRAVGTTGAPHPDAKALAESLMKEFINLKLI